MGQVSSRPSEGDSLYLRDPTRFSITGLDIVNSRNRTVLRVAPNGFPASRYTARREPGDDALVEYIQDAESVAVGGPPRFLLRLSNEEELTFNFTCVIRQSQASQSIQPPGSAAAAVSPNAPVDTVINGLTYIFAPTQKELDNLVTREFHADPNLHKNPNVQLVGDYSTSGSPSGQFQWSWKWKPPKATEDRGGGWRNVCSFVEYNQRAHRLDTLASFTFWMQNERRIGSPKSPSPRIELQVPPKLRVPSAQSTISRVSDSDGDNYPEYPEPVSPRIDVIPEYGLGLVNTTSTTNTNATAVNVACQRPGEDLSQVEDGPLFRATMKAMEQKTGNMRTKWKKVLKRAESALEAQGACNSAITDLMEALKEASTSNANAVQPAIEHYFDKIAREILIYEKLNTTNIQKLIIDPISKLYNVDLKQAENKKKEFEDESREYWAYVGRYLGQRSDSLKEKKRAETDSKYQTKRRNFELKRFDYSSFMQDLHGGRKDQEVLSNLTKYADAQARNYLETAKKVEAMLPQLEALTYEVKEADKEYQLQRTEREEKRRTLENSTKAFNAPESVSAGPSFVPSTPNMNGNRPVPAAESEQRTRQGSIPAFMSTVSPPPPVSSPPANGALGAPPPTPHASTSPGAQTVLPVGSPNQKFKGIRDLEDKDRTVPLGPEPPHGSHRKEGILHALSRPGSHSEFKGLNKQAWHKFWVVIDQGKLTEYSNWKTKMELHMDPIDLRVASVREARNSERRFCFEVITPQYTRVYQAMGEEDVKSWINALNNALQSAVEGKGTSEPVATGSLPSSTRRDIASVLTGKSTSLSSHRSGQGNTSRPSRHLTVGDRPSYRSSMDGGEDPSKLLQQVREADAGNKYCADCGSESKVEWVSINLGIVLCIECSGIHRSLGTHISKVRSLTLDTTSFTQDIIEVLLTIGNRVSNMVWEAKMDRSEKLSPNATREQRLRFITGKYADRIYVQTISPTLTHYSTPDETLLASIKKNDIQNVLYALALHANPNAADRSRSTHAVFLALAAADPASPSASASPATSPRRTSTEAPAVRKPFPIAEMLLQNGADLPPQPAPIPLSPAAKLYLDQKAEQRAGRRPGPAHGHSGGKDQLTALPHIVAGNGSTPGERAREREARLQKRVSAGGRLVKQMNEEGRRF